MYKLKEQIEDIVDKLSAKIHGQQAIVNSIVLPAEILNGVALQYKKGTANGYDVFYEDINHVYFVQAGDSRFPLISATTLIELFIQEFNTSVMSRRCAEKAVYDCAFLDTLGWEFLSVEQKADRIATAWETNSEDANGYGTAAHMGNEYLAKHPDMMDDQIYMKVLSRCGAVHSRANIRNILPNVRQVLRGFKANGYKCVAEPVLIEPDMCVAGQSDLVMVNHTTKKLWVLDYKSNSKRPGSTRSYSKMLGYFSQYASTEWYHYCIQLSLYAMMLQHQYPGYEIENMTLLWLEPTTGEVQPIPIDVSHWLPVIQDFKQYYMFNKIPQRVYQ